ncbi:MAG: U32 family peptidase [Candidatus Cloacimonetes bacterium]|nr:U32 family peptidase [Candidatus Cloacimonadota bacterium]MCF7813081.1 U32 family peptidase [Candidatus Cloacimonadota bacterium]MCF7867530.1 U32 family peptidase [Candidatus Cloacimonadota bacterium]MCF7883076.1 U32 family peptidase [Candidatus Cloacimonadota bacterium]
MKPELLVPVGNPEAFYAAIAGGADAVYLGLKNFNARGRARNFAPNQLQSILKESEKENIKVYLTLNTLIKNSELPQLLDTLFMLSQTSISALIIQDLGVYYLLQKFFEKIKIHGSTQMGFHNSLGAEFAYEKGFERIILARELTLPELKNISNRSKIQLEIFAHGALCYSFSGMCLFSSFLGGMSANRGLCRQPCRRIFNSEKGSEYFFSLKDNQQIEIILELMKMKIRSIKIEGRMKSAEYVHQVTRAYRMVIDDPNKIEQAKEILKFDLGRQKTSYFLGGNVKNAITQEPYTGYQIGEIAKISAEYFEIKTKFNLRKRNRLRILPQDGTDSKALKIKEIEKMENSKYKIHHNIQNIAIGDKVFLLGLGENKFQSKFSLDGKKLQLQMPTSKKKHILSRIGSSKTLSRQELFFRIDSVDWLRKIYFDKFDHLILKLPKNEWKKFQLKSNFIRKNIRKIIIQFPKFISENDLDFYHSLIKYLLQNRIQHFVLGHISQINLFKNIKQATISTSENVYVLNDAAIQMLKEERVNYYIYPFENEFTNLTAGKDRKGIVPIYFRPELFYSRMPVNDLPAEFSDRDQKYYKFIRDGITCIIPELPVSLLQYKNKLFKQGFRRFLIDLSNEKPSQNSFNRILKKFHTSEAEQPGTQFNFKLGLQ